MTKGSCLAGRVGLAALVVLFGCESLQNAAADSETRTLSMHHTHTDESITITYKRNGRYDDEALKKIDWFLRDWRRQESTHMDPKLLDIVWEAYTQLGAQKPIEIVCGYRAPATNEMLRRRSSGVAKGSLHTHGQAMDFYLPDVPLEQLRHAGLRLQRGGVGFYPSSGSPFVHLDTGNVRHWPHMSDEQMARVLNSRTVVARVDAPAKVTNPLAALFGVKSDDEDEADSVPARSRDTAAADKPKPVKTAAVPLPQARPTRAGATAVAQSKSTDVDADVIAGRGRWNGVAALTQTDAAVAVTKVAATDAPGAGTAPTAALAYAPDTSPRSAVQPIAESIVQKTSTPSPAVVRRAQPAREPASTGAVVATAAKAQNTDDLWTRAIMLAPDLQYFMSATLLGAPDFKQLRHLMQKPTLALAMSFSDDPLVGMSSDHFSGDNAVVFLATVPVTTQAAMLQQ